MSTYDDSSLFLYPSGYKASVLFAQKPMDANGQLAFTRSNDTATRVASNGLIEKVRTNLILQSNSFDTTWGNVNSTETSGQAGYDGTNNAWLLTSTLAGGYIGQSSFTMSGQTTFSVYAKAGTQNGIILYSSHVAQGQNFNLSTGTVGSAFVAAPLNAQIASVGGGWYRCSITVSSSTLGSLRIYVGDGSTSSLGNAFIQNSQAEAGDIATDYIPTTTAAVSVGPLANIPRIDYLGGGCGKLLLEPQRSNLALWSDQLDNAAWTKSNVTITANSIASPDGYTNADLITTSSTGDLVQQSFTLTSGTSYTGSFFLKAGTGTSIAILYSGAAFSAAQTVSFDLTTKQGTATSGTPTFTITDFGNGWLRCTITATATSTNTGNFRVASLSLDAVSTFYAWGAQLEAGAYATSYIPTLGASVTRGADACSKTGISSLIGQTEGTLFAEFSVPVNENVTRSIGVNDGTISNRVIISTFATSLFVRVDSGGVNQVNSSATIVPTAINKVAFRYKANDFAAYVNGVKVITDTSGSTFSGTTLSSFSFIQPDGTSPFNGVVKQILFFKTGLSDSDLAFLTA